MKLLITDDQQSLHLYIQKAINFESLGVCEILHAKNGAEAFEVITEFSPELMILDIQMPILDGIGLLELLKEKSISQPQTIILSAYNEFEYARKCMEFGVEHYILKPIDPDELTRKIEICTQKIQTQNAMSIAHLFKLCISGTCPKTYPTTKSLLSENEGYCSICVKNDEEAVFDVALVLDKAFAKSVEEEITYYLFVVKNEQEYYDLFRKVSLKTDFMLGLSLFYRQVEELSQSILEAKIALLQSFYKPKPRIYNNYDCFSNEKSMEFEAIKSIKEAFLAGDIQKAKDNVQQLFCDFEKKNIAPDFVIKVCYALLLSVNEDFFKVISELDQDSFSSEKIYYHADTLKSVFLRLLLSMMYGLVPSQTDNDLAIVGKIKSHIDQNLKNDLSLETISARFFISKFQVSRNFKKSFGINYQDYIGNARMTKAANLLKNTSLRLYEVCEEVGFDEPSYFSNVFKKYYGMSPKNYRELNQNNEKLISKA